MKKNKIVRKLKKFGKTTVLVLLLVSLNINPIAMISTVILETGIVGKFSNLGKNLAYLAGQKIESVYATELIPTVPSGPTEVSIVDTPTSYFSTTQNYLDWIRQYTSTLGNTEDAGSLYSILKELYDIGSNYSSSVKIDADSPEYRDYGESLAVHDEAMTARLLGVNERDMSHINAAQIEQLKQMGYDPRWIHENGTIEEDFDKLIRATHEYAVANVYSLNNMIGGALWRPYSDEIPYIREFAEIVGGFANVYMGYWDTNVSTLKQPINSQRALEILGYDAILRYEGIQVLEPSKILENGVEAVFVPEIVGLSKYVDSPVDRTIIDDPDVHYEEIPDRELQPSGLGGVPTGQSGVNENIILRQVRAGAGGVEYVPEDDVMAAIIPDSQIVQLYQEEIPNQDITWLDAVTVLYKALGKEQISYQTFTAYNPNITPETSPLSKDLPGLTEFDGYNFYAFFTRSNPYSGDLESGSFQAIYWRKAVNDGFVSYALRDQVISAEDFYMLAQRMMEAYGEPEMSADEMHTLLQIYGSYYPVQLGRTVADAWEYLKCRGILTEENEPESFTSNLTRDQLLDICMRIKDKDSRITYKNMNLTIDVGEVLRDKDYFPVYDFDLKTEEDDEFAFISTTVNYETYDYYTYMFPIQRAVTLGNSGCGLVYNKPEKSDENLIDKALYEGKKHIEGYDYYVIDVPKDYTGDIYLGFNNYDDPESVNGTVDFIRVPSYCLGGGIYTAYEIEESGKDTIATLVKPVEGTSYFPFSSQSNNMELVYYNDFKRCDTDRPAGAGTARAVWDNIVDTWNYLTQPMEVLAANIDEDANNELGDKLNAQIKMEFDSNANLVTKISANSDYWSAASTTYGSGENSFQLVDASGDVKQVAPNAPGWFSALTRASMVSASGMAVWGGAANGEISLSQFGERIERTNKDAKHDDHSHPGASFGMNIAQLIRDESTKDEQKQKQLYKDIIQLQANSAMKRRQGLIGFAAGIRPSDKSKISGSDTGPSDEMDKDIVSAMTYFSNNSPKWSSMIGLFNSVGSWGSNGNYTKATLTMYDSGTFTVYSNGYTDKNIRDFLGRARGSTESGIGGASDLKVSDISTSLNTSAIMNKNEQILLDWDDLVRAGFAWGIIDGKPKKSDVDGTYSFMTKNGMVKVSDINHMIQIGTTLYVWPDNDSAPNLVYVDGDGNMYFDIRCVTGIINVEVTELDSSKTEIITNSYGAGSYAVYSISTKGANTSLYKTKSISCYNFPDTPKTASTIASGSVFPVDINILETTVFDGEDTGTGHTYWEDGNDLNRTLLADFNPTSNWILTITEDEGMYQGKLYVYYLKDAFLTDKFSDGESPPSPSSEWEQYWEEQIETGIKRCEANHNSLTKQVESYMEDYASKDSSGGWITKMTTAAMYNIAADTGTFHLSPDYAVRCFDLTDNNIVSQPGLTDMTGGVEAGSADEEFRSNDAGTAYFMDYAGYIYNLPKYEDFTLSKYLSGEYLLPLVSYNGREVWNMNMTWYGNASNGDPVPYGCELTANGYINYSDLKVVDSISSNLPTRNSSDDSSLDEMQTDLPFDLPEGGSEQTGGTFKPAPVAIYARYGILDSGISATRVGVISQNETVRNYYYLGNRVVCISDNFMSNSADKIPFDYASEKYNPVAIKAVSEAHFVGQVRRPFSRSYYVLLYADIYKVTSAIADNSQEEHLATDDSYLWDGKAKLVSVLNMIDRSTNWLMWAVFSLAPMICIIVMTILIGLSFITDNKIWLNFCEKFFDPVRILTLGIKDSNHWRWQDVWKRATITYIAFALFANANILKIVIWAVDGWMRITEALGF